MTGRRNRRAGVEDRWYKTVTVTEADSTQKRERVPSASHGTGKRWRARYVDDESQEHSKAFARKADANAWLDEVTSSLVIGTHVAPSAGREFIGKLGPRWLKAQAHLKETTGSSRRYTWQAHVRPRWSTTAVRDVRSPAVREWVADMVTAKIGVPTIETAVGILRGICETAVEERQISRNPCAKVKLPKRRQKRRGYLTHRQVAQLAREVTENSTAIRLLAYTGLRWGEMAALKVGSFDMLRRRVNIVEAVAEVEGRLVWSDTKTYQRRSVPFPKLLADELAALMRGKDRDALVFTSTEGEVLRVSTYRPRVFAPAVTRQKKAARKARAEEIAKGGETITPDFPTVTPHDLRHTAASLAISAGANPKAVQIMLGHKSAAMTLDTYADLFPDDLEAVADALDRAARAANSQTADGLRTGTDSQDRE